MIPISVVIPCYNSSKTILKCLNSVCKQTFSPLEIIVIDDGSGDDTVSLVREFMIKSQIPILLVEQINSGPSVARNKGVSIAKGQWIAFLDSDDYWLEDKLETQTKVLSKFPNIRLLGCFDSNKTEYQRVFFNKILYNNRFQTSSVLIYKEVMLEYHFDELQKYSEDYKCWLEVIYKYEGGLCSPKKAFPIFKEIPYIGGGLSSRLWEMEKGEINNYLHLLRTHKINLFQFGVVFLYSFVKYLRRLFISYLHNEK